MNVFILRHSEFLGKYLGQNISTSVYRLYEKAVFFTNRESSLGTYVLEMTLKARTSGGSAVFYSRASEALFLFIRLLLDSYVAFGPSPQKRLSEEQLKDSTRPRKFTLDYVFGIDILNLV